MRRMVISGRRPLVVGTPSWSERPTTKDQRPSLELYSRVAQALDRRFRTQGRIVHLFKRIRFRFRRQNRHDFDVPVIILVNRLPVTKVSRPMQAVGRGMQYQVKFFGDGAYALQGSPQQGA